MLRFKKRGADNPQPLGDCEPWLAAILRSRGIDDEEKAERFLHPSLEQLHDPLLMQDMDKAVAILRKAAEEKTSIVIYGDYDCDGVCATSIMMETLREMGATVTFRIPKRSEGYGLNKNVVRELAEAGHQVLLTVDCGVTNLEEVTLAKALGLCVIVTDHHQVAEKLPEADAVLNPLLGSYPFRRLCGAGVALKMTQALLGMDGVQRRLDLAAIATVADLVPLIDENRVIVSAGLKCLTNTQRPGLDTLKTLAGINGEMKSEDLGFRIGPRINAGGRLEDAAQCVHLLIDQEKLAVDEIARNLHGLNSRRQTMQTEIIEKAEKKLAQEMDLHEDQVMLVMGEDWDSGIIGLAAGRLCEKYHYPAIVLSKMENGLAVGSCRSIPGVNIHKMLTTCQDLFVRFGGHEQAAGLTMEADKVPELRVRLNRAISELCDPTVYLPEKEYDAELSLADVDRGLVDRLQLLEPTGFGNPPPVFLTKRASVQSKRAVGKTMDHLKVELCEGGAVLGGIAFQLGSKAQQPLDRVDVLYVPGVNEYMGRATVQMQVQALQPSAGTAQLDSQERLFPGLLREIEVLSQQAEREQGTVEKITQQLVKELVRTGRGTLLIAHERELANRYAMEMDLEMNSQRVESFLPYSVVLTNPILSELQDVWHDIVLLDGDLLPGEAAMIAEKCPRAKLHRMQENPGLAQLLQSVTLRREQHLVPLYRSLMQGNGRSAEALAENTGLTVMQVLCGLTAFAQTGLIEYSPAPFRVVVLPATGAKKDMIQDSSVLRYLHRRNQDSE